MKYYTARPLAVQALQFTGTNYSECEHFVKGHYNTIINMPNIINSRGITIFVNNSDYIIKDSYGEFSVMDSDTFKEAYEIS